MDDKIYVYMKPKEIMDTIEVSGARFKIKIHQDEEGWYVVKSDDLKGLSTQGKSIKEARANAVDAAESLLSIATRWSVQVIATNKNGTKPLIYGQKETTVSDRQEVEGTNSFQATS